MGATSRTSTLALQPHLREAFVAIASALSPFPLNVVMVGGSVLAAHWQHRVSTDIDLFVRRVRRWPARRVAGAGDVARWSA